RRANSAAAIENQLGVLVGNSRLDVTLQNSATEVLGAADVTGGPLALLPYVDDLRFSCLELLSRLVDADFAHPGFCVVDELEESGRVLHNPAGACLPVSC